MRINEFLDKQLEDKQFVQDTTFSIDPIGNRICTSWKNVDTANKNQPFDVVIIGAGMFGGYCAEKLFRRDARKKLRILVLEAGPFFLPTHINNLPLGGMPQDVWARPWTGKPPFVIDDPDNPNYYNNKKGMAFCVGGRSLFWAGWAPKLMPGDLKKWPEDVRNFLNSPDGYDRTAIEIGSKQKTELIEETDNYKKLFGAFKTVEGMAFGDGRIEAIEPAPLAVMASRPTPGIFPFDQYSSVTFLIDAINQDVNDSKNNLPDRRLILLPRAEVTRLNREGDAVTSLDLDVHLDGRGVKQTLHLGPKTTVVLANGTIEATRLALANLGVGQQAQPPKVGNFMTHMGNSRTVRIRREALGLGKPSQSGNDVAAFMVRCEAFGRRFHYQVVAAALKRGGGGSPWDFVMRLMPDVDQLDRWIGDRDPDWISIVFRGIGEMEGNLHLNAPDEWKNSIRLKGDIADVELDLSGGDTKLRGVMDQVAIDLAKHLARDSNNIEYPTEPDHSDIGTTYHEGGTLFMGKVKESITNTHGKFHHLPNVYVAGPALFPTLGSANPSLTGLSLARRTADAILTAHGITPPGPGQPPLVA
jgi:choline dehydrogenase-like flavoprotein